MSTITTKRLRKIRKFNTTKKTSKRRVSMKRDPEEATTTRVSTETTSDRMKAKKELTPREEEEAEVAEEATEAEVEEVVTTQEKMLTMMASKPSRRRPTNPREVVEVAAEAEASEATTEVAEAGEVMVTLVTIDPTLTPDQDVAEERFAMIRNLQLSLPQPPLRNDLFRDH